MTTTIKVTDSSGNVTTATVQLNVSTPPTTAKKIMGMSAPANLWNQRLAEVGANGIRARRVFGDLQADGKNQSGVIAAAFNANMIPIVSYKVPSVSNAINGAYDAWATATANYLNSFGKTCAVTIWHEPRGDMTPAQFVQLHERLMPLMKRPNVKVGPILNLFLVTGTASQKTEFTQYSNANLLNNVWDWFGGDSYHPSETSSIYAGDRIAPVVKFLTDRGKPNMPIVIGEYNGFTAEAIASAGEKFLAAPTLWIASVFNSDVGNLGFPLAGDRLTAFKKIKADPRVLQ